MGLCMGLFIVYVIYVGLIEIINNRLVSVRFYCG